MSYLGSKGGSGVYQKIIAAMPPHDTYIETHLGSGAVMLRKPPALRNIGLDIDSETLKEFAFTHQLAHISLVNRDAVDYLSAFDFARAGRVLVYADPPYMPETRTSHNRYRCEYTVADHVRLLTCLMSLPGNVTKRGAVPAVSLSLTAASLTFIVPTLHQIRTKAQSLTCVTGLKAQELSHEQTINTQYH